MTPQNPDSMDLKALWKDQKSEYPTLSAEEVRSRVGSYHAKVRREGAFSLALSAAVAIVCGVLTLMEHPGRLIAMSVGMMAFTDLWWEVALFYRSRDTVWPWLPKTAMTGESPTVCVDFYRVNLELHQRNWFMNYIDMYFMVPVFLINVFRLHNQIPIQFHVLAAIFMFLMILVRKSQARRVALELGALDAVRSR